MYNEQIENLITLALADGELTEKEKQILFKKAEAAGIDLDEFEMVLDAKLFEKNQIKTSETHTVSAPKSDKFGDIKKCPSCGAIVQSFTGKCADCSYEFRDMQSDVTINKLFEALMEADAVPMEQYKESDLNKTIVKNSGNSFGVFGSVMSHANESSARINETNREEEYIKRHQEKILSRKTQIISNFPVPNSKESLLEFFTLGISKAKSIKKGLFGSYNASEKEHNVLAPVWKAKCEQVLMKAKFALKDDKSTLSEIENLFNQLNEKK
jgi:hypothetical protein